MFPPRFAAMKIRGFLSSNRTEQSFKLFLLVEIKIFPFSAIKSFPFSAIKIKREREESDIEREEGKERVKYKGREELKRGEGGEKER